MKPYRVQLTAENEWSYSHKYTVYVPAANLVSAAKKARTWAKSGKPALKHITITSIEELEGNIAA